jgi:dihydroorotase
MKIILKNITLINPQQQLNRKSNLVIDDGIVSKIGNLTNEDLKNAKVLEMNNKYISPGFLDMHVHLREPGREDEETIESGCNAAMAGGFTAVACMPNTDPAIDSAEVVTLIKTKSEGHLVDVYPVAAATVERKGEVLSPMIELKAAGAVGFSDDGSAIKSARILRTALEYSSMLGLPVIEHAEEDSLAGGAMNESYNSTLLGLPVMPSVAEDIIVARDILMSEYVKGKLHIAHISSKGSVELIRNAKAKGVKVSCEVTPHHFTLNDESVKSYDTNTKMNPPLRTNQDVLAVIEGLRDGTIDCIASDHAPHAPEEKEVEFAYAPNGIIGLETEVGLTFTELYHKKVLSLEQVVEKLAINPRKILMIDIPKFEVGASANFTIFDPDEIWTVDISKFKSKSRNTPFNKRLLSGKAIATINNKKMWYQNELINI